MKVSLHCKLTFTVGETGIWIGFFGWWIRCLCFHICKQRPMEKLINMQGDSQYHLECILLLIKATQGYTMPMFLRPTRRCLKTFLNMYTLYLPIAIHYIHQKVTPKLLQWAITHKEINIGWPLSLHRTTMNCLFFSNWYRTLFSTFRSTSWIKLHYHSIKMSHQNW